MCEVMGRADGYSKGRGGKMHMGDLSFGFIGNTGTVGATVPIATGSALAARLRGSKEVVVSFMGDGAMNQGVVHEAMNFAGLWKLPVIYICENNHYAMTVSLEKSVAIKHIADRAKGYGFEGKVIDGNDVELVYEETRKAAEKGRSGEGATFLECLTYRWDGHFGGDPGTGYRPKEEIEKWKERCPIKRLKERLIGEGNLTSEEFDRISATVYAEIEQVALKAQTAPLPSKEVDPDSLFARLEVAHG
jgi:pyruvate dehydrogenase E1 component alpha subunit